MALSAEFPVRGQGWQGDLAWRYLKVPLFGLLRYGPSVLLALPAAYASAQFAMHHTIFPEPLAWMIGIAFEWMYLGTLAMSSALRTSAWFRRVNLLAVGTSILYVTLYAAGKYGALDGMAGAMLGGWSIGGALLWLFSVIHAAPLAGLNYMYNSLIHEYHQEQRQDEQAAAERVQCPHCGEWRRNQASLYRHYRECPSYPRKM